jgi:hypothetical protein
VGDEQVFDAAGRHVDHVHPASRRRLVEIDDCDVARVGDLVWMLAEVAERALECGGRDAVVLVAEDLVERDGRRRGW